MRRLLNTLYVTTPESYLSKDGMNVVISIKKQEVFRIPIINIEAIVVFGYMGVSPGLMKLCVDNGVSLTFLNPNGKFVSRIQGQTKGNILLRQSQYRLADNLEWSLHIAKLMVAGKIRNSRSVLRRYIRDYGENKEVETAANILELEKEKALSTNDKSELMGIEGIAANQYFSVFSNLILQQNNDFPFNGRNRRPPKDAVNAMLSLAYTLLANDTASALETVGLDPYMGFFHSIRPGRTSLALDLMEELRAYIGDRFVLSLINRRQISSGDFFYQGEKGVILTDKGRQSFLTAWQTRKKEEITHPYLNEKVPMGLLPYIQAMLLARVVREDLDDYPVFIYK